ncbi:aspartate/glutamate racemase family protein [Sphingomonas quercus]|uniref:Amino acid racemase n=1 Tax=Sphingomonas quercus TaxID=2842451 RepID=A0ABS6BLM0_9SPHN|nr:amino acid racemase [Sphingomonas quercus]MBU3079205.1 amino acid racemase [Sphingomonas quercus]
MKGVIGILGGMGPAATVDFMARLLAATPAQRDEDHYRILVDCNPHVPNRNRAAAGEASPPGPVLAGMARGLERQGATLLAMPCNAAHAYTADIRAAVSIPFVSMIEETGAALAARHPEARRVGLLAVDGTLAAGLYQPYLPEPVLLPAEAQAHFMALIYRIKAGDTSAKARAEMAAFAATLVDAGAQAVVAGCTEVPLVLDGGDVAAPLLSTTDILVAATLALASAG